MWWWFCKLKSWFILIYFKFYTITYNVLFNIFGLSVIDDTNILIKQVLLFDSYTKLSGFIYSLTLIFMYLNILGYIYKVKL